MPLQNRVSPTGEVVADSSRGAWMGNRGGCFHDDNRRLLPRRRWAGKAWIVCRLTFKSQHRTIMAPGRYTELFFLDEATALAAGHRPCFECRRDAFIAYATAWNRAEGRAGRAYVAEMDDRLHQERGAGQRSKYSRTKARLGDLPVGAFVLFESEPHLVAQSGALLRWSFAGYDKSRKIGDDDASYDVLTPSPTIAVLQAGYQPQIDPSASGSGGLT